MELWGKYMGGEWELINEADSANSIGFLLAEYRMAYGAGWSFKTRRKKG